MVDVARPTSWLVRRCCWIQVRRRPVKELRHVWLECISVIQGWKVESGFDELEHCRKVHRSVGHKMRLGKGRNHHKWNPKSGQGEITRRVSGRNIHGRNSVGINGLHRRSVVVQSTAFIEGQEENAVLP